MESALVSHEQVCEAAVVGRPDDLKGQAIAAFVTVTGEASEELRKELRMHVRSQIGAQRSSDIDSRRPFRRLEVGKSCVAFCVTLHQAKR